MFFRILSLNVRFGQPQIFYENESKQHSHRLQYSRYLLFDKMNQHLLKPYMNVSLLRSAYFITKRLDHIEMSLIKIEKMVCNAGFDDLFPSTASYFWIFL